MRILVALALAGAIALAMPSSARAQLGSCLLDWTATGDDGNVGTATRYDLRWATTRPDTTSLPAVTSWWNAATVVDSLPVPLVAGTPQSARETPAGGFVAGRTYYFVLVAVDDAGNVSPFSNVAWIQVQDTTPPGCPCNLRLRIGS